MRRKGDDEVTVVGLYPSSEADTPVSLLNVGGDPGAVSETALVEYFDAQGIDTLHIILCHRPTAEAVGLSVDSLSDDSLTES